MCYKKYHSGSNVTKFEGGKIESQLNQLGQKVEENMFKVFKEKLFFKNEGKIKTFPHTQKLKEFIASTHALQEILKEVFQAEHKCHQAVI